MNSLYKTICILVLIITLLIPILVHADYGYYGRWVKDEDGYSSGSPKKKTILYR